MIDIGVELPEKLKSLDDDNMEHLRCGGDWHSMSMQRNGEYCMHKMHGSYIYTVQRREGLMLLLELQWLLLLWGKFKCEQGGRAQEQRCTLEEGFIKGTWCTEHKKQKNR